MTATDKGENIMQQEDTTLPEWKASTIFNRVIQFFGIARFSTPQPDRLLGNIDWPDSDSDPKQSYFDNYKPPISGGYNEAFIVQYWTSYHLR